MIEILIYLALFVLGFITGLSQSLITKPRQSEQVEVAEISIDDAIEIIEYLKARNRHPSNYRFRHPEMEEEDDC